MMTTMSSPDVSTTLISDIIAWKWDKRTCNKGTTKKICAKGWRFFRKFIKRGSLVLQVKLLYLTVCSHEYDTQVVGTLPAQLGLVVAQWHIGACNDAAAL